MAATLPPGEHCGCGEEQHAVIEGIAAAGELRPAALRAVHWKTTCAEPSRPALAWAGMAEVREACDLRLSSPVAVKPLRPGLAARPENQLRFEAEARGRPH
jgi:hypothetical protein